MNPQHNWQAVLGARISRRDALRMAALGAVGLPLTRFSALAHGTGTTAAEYTLQLAQLPPASIPTDVVARKGNKKAWAQLQGVSIAQVEVPAGAWRSPHLHTNTPELAVVLQGSVRVGLQTPQKEWLELDLEAGDCVYFPLGWPHWFRNTGSGAVRAYFNYGHEQPETVEVQAADLGG
jgi:mannose-6-phosphate isomerase-like protein (cupin superfamily)